MNADFQGIEIHSRKVFNTVKEKATTAKHADESVGPMVNSKIGEFFSVYRQRSRKTNTKEPSLAWTCLFGSVLSFVLVIWL